MYFFIFIKEKGTFVKCFVNETCCIIFIAQGGINVMNKETNIKKYEKLLTKICEDFKIKNSKYLIKKFMKSRQK